MWLFLQMLSFAPHWKIKFFLLSRHNSYRLVILSAEFGTLRDNSFYQNYNYEVKKILLVVRKMIPAALRNGSAVVAAHTNHSSHNHVGSENSSDEGEDSVYPYELMPLPTQLAGHGREGDGHRAILKRAGSFNFVNNFWKLRFPSKSFDKFLLVQFFVP